MTMGHREKLKNYDEWTAFSGWRHVVARMEKPGVTKKIKRLFNRRIRRQINSELGMEIVDEF